MGAQLSAAAVLSLALSVALFIGVTLWGFLQIRKILATLTRYERARKGLRLEVFTKSDTEFTAKFNRNFERLQMASRGERVIEHEWTGPEPFTMGRRKAVGKCRRCGMTMEQFYLSSQFLGCKDEEASR